MNLLEMLALGIRSPQSGGRGGVAYDSLSGFPYGILVFEQHMNREHYSL